MLEWLLDCRATVSIDGRAKEVLTLAAPEIPLITSIDADDRAISYVPEEIFCASGLMRLNISRNMLDDLPDELGYLPNLQHLSAGRNTITHVPLGLCESTSLRSLSLGRNRLSELPQSIEKMSNLQLLNVRGNSLTGLPDSLTGLGRLAELDVSENKISAISLDFSGLISLRRFYVSGNELQRFPETLSQLVDLESLALSSNRLRELPVDFYKMSGLREVWLYDNPFEFPPMAVIEAGIRPIQGYLRAIGTGRSVLRINPRILIVGPPGAGKSSIIQRLVSNTYSEIRQETLGIDISVWAAADEVENISLWDFGGQRYMHAAHRLFLDKGNVFVLVTDEHSVEELDYWLELIRTLAIDPRVLVVANKADLAHVELDQRRLRQKYTFIAGFASTSCLSGHGFIALRADLWALAQQSVRAVQDVPTVWTEVYSYIATLDQPLMSRNSFAQLAAEFGISHADDLASFVEVLGRMGAILSLDRLEDRPLVLQPQWVIRAVYAVLTSRLALQNWGKVRRSAARALIEAECGANDVSLILDVLVKYEYCFSTLDGDLIVPELLPVEPVEWPDIPVSGVVHYILALDTDALFAFARVLARLAPDIQTRTMARRRVALSAQHLDAYATVEADRHSGQIEISCWGATRVAYIGHLHLEIKSVIRSITDTPVRTLVRVQGIGELLDYDDLVGKYLMGETVHVVGRQRLRLQIADILFATGNAESWGQTMGPVYNFNQSSVSFGSGNANTYNVGEMRSVATRLSEALRTSDLETAESLASELEDAADKNDSSRLRELGARALDIGAKVAPVAVLANALREILGG